MTMAPVARTSIGSFVSRSLALASVAPFLMLRGTDVSSASMSRTSVICLTLSAMESPRDQNVSNSSCRSWTIWSRTSSKFIDLYSLTPPRSLWILTTKSLFSFTSSTLHRISSIVLTPVGLMGRTWTTYISLAVFSTVLGVFKAGYYVMDERSMIV